MDESWESWEFFRISDLIFFFSIFVGKATGFVVSVMMGLVWQNQNQRQKKKVVGSRVVFELKMIDVVFADINCNGLALPRGASLDKSTAQPLYLVWFYPPAASSDGVYCDF